MKVQLSKAEKIMIPRTLAPQSRDILIHLGAEHAAILGSIETSCLM